MYHNRGDSTFAGESANYGDFVGLDDLFTERPDVAKGMGDIYAQWVDFGIDDFRLDHHYDGGARPDRGRDPQDSPRGDHHAGEPLVR